MIGGRLRAEDLGGWFGYFRDPDHGRGYDDQEDGTDGDDGSGKFRRGDDERGEEDVDEGGLEEDNPAELHELVVAETRHRPADEDEEQDEDHEFCDGRCPCG